MPPRRAMRREGAKRGRGARGVENMDRVVGHEADLQTKIFDRFLKRDPPKFSGADSPILALEFIRDLEAIFEPMGINGGLRTKFAVYRLHGGARDWWENVNRSLVSTGQTPVHANEKKKIERFRDRMNWQIRTRLSLMNFVTFHEILNAALYVELELTEFQTIGEKIGRQDVPRFSGPASSGFQGRPSQRSCFSQSRYSASIANSRFSIAAYVPREFNRFGGSRGVIPGVRGNGGCFRYGHITSNCLMPQRNFGGPNAIAHIQPVRDGVQGNRGGQFGGMDWLGRHHAVIDCHLKKIEISSPKKSKILFLGDRKILSSGLISALVPHKLLRKGCVGYIAHVVDTRKEDIEQGNVHVVRDYVDVFPKELIGLPLVREVEFSIEVLLGIAPISMAPYRMAPTELEELKTQLQELLDKGFSTK
ncbi:hypothetical protein LIER_16413 [Lithospermum erythrorhizon]|uniref:Uncharacterized protein n=1 Tax=Lithospermum erythrorhizon TaxID=34254 RepID=A0AAV3Q9S1_LITER